MQHAQFHEVDFDLPYADLSIRHGDATRPFVVVNMVSTVDGKATLGSRAGHLGTAVDRRLMRQVRAGCDALMYGVGTLRAENVDPRVPEPTAALRVGRGQAAQPRRIVVSATGDLPLENLFFRVAGEPPVVFTTSSAGAARIASLRKAFVVFVAGLEAIDLRLMALTLARDLSVRSVVLEGGPALTYSMLRAGLVDEVLLTIAPKIVGGEKALTIAEGPELAVEDVLALDLVSVYREGAELFLRYRTVARHRAGDR